MNLFKRIFAVCLIMTCSLNLSGRCTVGADVTTADNRYVGYIPVQTYFEMSLDRCTPDNFIENTWLMADTGRLDVVNGSSRVYAEMSDGRGYCLRIQTKPSNDSVQLRMVSDENMSNEGSNLVMSSGVYRLKFDFKLATNQTPRELMMFHPAGKQTDKYHEKYFLNTVNADGSVSGNFRIFGNDTSIPAEADRWYSAEYIFDYESDVMTVGIDGMYFEDYNLVSYDYFRPFAYAGVSDFTYYDDIILEKIEAPPVNSAANFKLSDFDGNEFINLEKGFRASCDISADADSKSNVMLIGAVYSKEGKLSRVFASKADMEPGQDAVRLQIEAEASKYEGEALKVMIFGGQGVMPLAKADGNEIYYEEYKNLIIMFEGSEKAISFGTVKNTGGALPFEQSGIYYVPAGFVMEELGYSVNEDEAVLNFEGDTSGQLNVQSKSAVLNGSSIELQYYPVFKDSCIYVSVDDAELIGGRKFSVQNHVIIAGSENRIGKVISNPGNADSIFRTLVTDTPTKKQLWDFLKKSHPRIMADDSTFENIKAYCASGDARAKEWRKSVIAIADAALSEASVAYILQNGLRLENCENLGHINELSFAYALTGDTKYAKKAWLQIAKICNFPDWNSEAHFLDTSGIMQTMAVAYDWLYPYLNDAQKSIMLTAIKEKGLEAYLKQYEADAFWVRASHNWNGVCNSGAAKLAVAVMDEPEITDIAMEVMLKSFDSVSYMLGGFRPDGAWNEGVGYWYYMNRSFIQYMWTLEKAFGTTFGIADVPGIRETGYFPAHMTGPGGVFNISEDGPGEFTNAPETAWFAEYFEDEALRRLRYDEMDKHGFEGSMVDLLLYKPVDDDVCVSLPDDKYYRGIETTVVRSSRDDNALFFAMKGGSNGHNHAHMEAGTFVLDANGVRWITGLDGDDYNLDGYFDQRENGKTWEYYRLRAEGHNTMVINPDLSGGQRVSNGVTSKVTRFESNQTGAISVIDLTRNYDKSDGTTVAKSIIRGAKVDKVNGVVTVQDEIELASPGSIYWFMHTDAKIELLPGGKSAVLSKNGKKCNVYLASDSDAVFEVMQAVPLDTSPNPAGQNANENYRKLVIKLKNVRTASLSVIFDTNCANQTPDSPGKIAGWTLY